MAQVGVVLFVPLYLVDIMEFSPEGEVATMMLMQVGGMVASMIAGTMSVGLDGDQFGFAGVTATTVVIVGITFISHDLLFIAGVSVLDFVLFAVRPVMQGWMMDLPRNSAAPQPALCLACSAFQCRRSRFGWDRRRHLGLD